MQIIYIVTIATENVGSHWFQFRRVARSAGKRILPASLFWNVLWLLRFKHGPPWCYSRRLAQPVVTRSAQCRLPSTRWHHLLVRSQVRNRPGQGCSCTERRWTAVVGIGWKQVTKRPPAPWPPSAGLPWLRSVVGPKLRSSGRSWVHTQSTAPPGEEEWRGSREGYREFRFPTSSNPGTCWEPRRRGRARKAESRLCRGAATVDC